MASNEDRSASRRALNLIHDRREEVEHIRGVAQHYGVDADIKQQFAAAIIRFYDVLEVYEGDAAIEHDWPDIAPLRERLFQQKQVRTRCKRPNDGHTYKQVPAITEVDVGYLFRAAKALERIYADLGFAAPTRDVTEHTEATHDDLAALLADRGQDEALDKIPGGES
jgi:predicted glycoside hydrolase/deacetylase ChbG (UPF0249 family)